MEVRMKRLWVWMKGLFPFSTGYRFLRKTVKSYKKERVAIRIEQRVYRRRRLLRHDYWHGTVHIVMRVVGVRLVYRLDVTDEPFLGMVLSATEEYSLRRDADYVCLLRHLLFMQDACDLSEAEKEFLRNFKVLVMAMWPPRSNLDIRDCIYGAENACNRLP